MVAESLQHRIADFLKKYPPFSFLPEEALLRLSRGAEVEFRQPGEILFHQGDAPGASFYVVHQGHVQLVMDEGDRLVESLDEGDILGIGALIASRSYLFTARTREDCILYRLPWEAFEEIIQSEPRVLRFFSSGFSAGMHHVRRRPRGFEGGDGDDRAVRDEFLKLRMSKKVIQCSPSTIVAEAARIMTEHRVGSILITDAAGHPRGIITDSDMRKKVATGKVAVTAPVHEAMSSPVFTATADLTPSDAVVLMMKRNIRHVVITEDGTPESALLGVVSEHDILLLHGNNPAVLVKEAMQAESFQALRAVADRGESLLKEYLEQGVAIAFVCNTMAEIYDEIVERAVKLAAEGIRASGAEVCRLPCAWLGLQFEGRREQLLRTQRTNALVYADPPPGMDEEARLYFTALARGANAGLIECGFRPSGLDDLAEQGRCAPLHEWQGRALSWSDADEGALDEARTLLDLRCVAGDAGLADALRASLHGRVLQLSPSFVEALARDALRNHPPLSFFRSFIVDRSGEHRDRFDLLGRCIRPLADAARVLVLAHGKAAGGGTLDRFRLLAQLEPENAAIYGDAGKAYGIYLHFMASSGLRDGDEGFHIHPDRVNKLDRQSLRNSFSVIDEVQKIVRDRF